MDILTLEDYSDDNHSDNYDSEQDDYSEKNDHLLNDKLEGLASSGCMRVQALPDSLSTLRSLQKLDMYSCSTLKSLPAAFGHLCNLRQLVVK